MNKRVILSNLGILLFIILMVMISLYVPPLREKDIYGIWKGECNGTEFLFKFNRDGTCVLSFKDKASGSTETVSGNFEIDFSKDPIPLTIRNIPQLDHPLHTIVKFTGHTVISLAPFAPRWRLRPVSFDPQTSINLKKKGDV